MKIPEKHNKADCLQAATNIRYSLIKHYEKLCKANKISYGELCAMTYEALVIKNFLLKIYKHAFSPQEIHDATPVCLQQFLPTKLRNIKQSFNIDFFFNDQEIIKEYKKLLPLMELHSVSELLYPS